MQRKRALADFVKRVRSEPHAPDGHPENEQRAEASLLRQVLHRYSRGRPADGVLIGHPTERPQRRDRSGRITTLVALVADVAALKLEEAGKA